ncbi:hypothetical protein SAMD00019534_026350, partial [Acytostelium subglobosum LB1]|uniref:hypothetical protein n=1 Tax=Acytostelium subglobosum LB1 TaxID=1410327 RepID=UPI000644AFBE
MKRGQRLDTNIYLTDSTSIKEMKIDNLVGHPIDGSVLPRSLTSLTMDDKFDEELINLPPSLTCLTLCSRTNGLVVHHAQLRRLNVINSYALSQDLPYTQLRELILWSTEVSNLVRITSTNYPMLEKLNTGLIEGHYASINLLSLPSSLTCLTIQPGGNYVAGLPAGLQHLVIINTPGKTSMVHISTTWSQCPPMSNLHTLELHNYINPLANGDIPSSVTDLSLQCSINELDDSDHLSLSFLLGSLRRLSLTSSKHNVLYILQRLPINIQDLGLNVGGIMGPYHLRRLSPTLFMLHDNNRRYCFIHIDQLINRINKI